MKTKSPLPLPAVMLSAALLLAPAAAFGQTAVVTPDDATQAAVADDVIVLEEFNVSDSSRTDEWIATQALTGSRTAEKIVDLPYQMQVITDEFLQDFNLVSVVEQLSSVSGLVLEADQSDPVAAASRGVAGNTDTKLRGFPIIPTRDGFKHAQPPTASNTQQIEVIKGPVSVFYGNTQPGGMINYISRRPGTRTEVRGKISAGSYDYWEAEAYFNVPVVPKKVFLLASYDELHRKSDIEYVETKNTTAYGSLLFKPFKFTNITVTYERQEYSGNRGGTPNFYVNTRLNDGATDQRNWNTNSGTDAGLYWDWVKAGLNSNGPDYWINRDYDRLHVQFEQKLARLWSFKAAFQWQKKLTDIQGWNVTAVSVADNAAPGTPLTMNGFVPEVTYQDWRWPYSFMADLRGEFKTGKIKHTILASFDASRMIYDTGEWRNRNPNSSSPNYDAYLNMRYRAPWDPDFVWDTSWFSWDTIRSEDRDVASLYRRQWQRQRLLGGSLSEVMRMFNDRLIIRGTLRYDETHYAYHIARSANSYVYPWEDGFTGWMVGNDYEITHSLGVNWKFFNDDRLLVFANYSTSFDTTMTIDNGVGKVMPNETGEGYEFGIKSVTKNGKLSCVLSGFWIEKDNIAQTNPLYASGADVAQYSGIGTELVKGVDMDINYSITRNLAVIASAAHLKSEITKSPGTPLNVGKRKLRVPDSTASISVKYKFPGWLRGLEVGARMRYQGDWTRTHYQPGSATTSEVAREVIGGTTLWNAYIKYQWRSGKRMRHILQLNGNNLFDKVHTGVGSSRSLGLQVNLTYRITYR